MIKLIIDEECETVGDLSLALEHITNLIDQGFTSGHHPFWHLEGDPEKSEDDEE